MIDADGGRVALHAEQKFVTQRDECQGDGARVATLGFVDDMHFRFAFDRCGKLWTKTSAMELAVAAECIYPAPLELE